MNNKKIKMQVTFHDEVVFDDGTRVLVHRLLDEGEFRHVYLARDVRNDKQLYALKRVDCPDDKAIEQCRKEVATHQLFHHENIMPLFGSKFVQTEEEAYSCSCFLLFPYLPCSLDDEIAARRLREDRLESQRRPFSWHQAMSLFAGVVRATDALHRAGFSHRDIRVENVLLEKPKKKRRGEVGMPILSDFGSVGQLTMTISDIAKAQEDVDQSTTSAYRAPELFELSQQYTTTERNILKYGPADVWSLGCLLFAMLYGLSPFEMEWRLSLVEGMEANATVQFVGTIAQESVLEPVPFPPDGSAADIRYPIHAKRLIQWMLNKKANERPSTSEILQEVDNLLDKKETH